MEENLFSPSIVADVCSPMTCQYVVYRRSLPHQSVILLRLQKMLRLVLAVLALIALAQGNTASEQAFSN